MEAVAGKRLDVDEVLSRVDGLWGVVRASDDADANAQAATAAEMLLSACRSEAVDVEQQLREYQEKIRSCKEKIDKVKAETITDDELLALQNTMEEKLQEEKALRKDLKVVRDEVDNLDCQNASIVERKEGIKKKEKAMRKAERLLSMYVSVTNIMPNLEDEDKISGYIVDKNRKKIKKFEFEKTEPPVEISDNLWKMI